MSINPCLGLEFQAAEVCCYINARCSWPFNTNSNSNPLCIPASRLRVQKRILPTWDLGFGTKSHGKYEQLLHEMSLIDKLNKWTLTKAKKFNGSDQKEQYNVFGKVIDQASVSLNTSHHDISTTPVCYEQPPHPTSLSFLHYILIAPSNISST